MSAHRWTGQEIAALAAALARGLSYAQTAAALSARFGRRVTLNAVAGAARARDLKTRNTRASGPRFRRACAAERIADQAKQTAPNSPPLLRGAFLSALGPAAGRIAVETGRGAQARPEFSAALTEAEKRAAQAEKREARRAANLAKAREHSARRAAERAKRRQGERERVAAAVAAIEAGGNEPSFAALATATGIPANLILVYAREAGLDLAAKQRAWAQGLIERAAKRLLAEGARLTGPALQAATGFGEGRLRSVLAAWVGEGRPDLDAARRETQVHTKPRTAWPAGLRFEDDPRAANDFHGFQAGSALPRRVTGRAYPQSLTGGSFE